MLLVGWLEQINNIKTKDFLEKTNLKPKIIILQFCVNDFMNNYLGKRNRKLWTILKKTIFC